MDLEEAETTYAKAKEQITIWSQFDSGFARQQVELWTEILIANRWIEPGRARDGS